MSDAERARVVVAGAGNQIGSYLVPELLARGCSVIAIARRGRPPWIEPDPRLDWRPLDLAQPLAQIEDATALVFVAPLGLFGGLWRGLSGVPRVVAFSSTSRLTKADSPDPVERAVVGELALGERTVQELAQAAGAAAAVLRPTLIYGAGLDAGLTRLAAWLGRVRVMPLAGGGRGLRQPVHAADLATAAANLVLGQKPVNGCYELSGGSTLSYRDMIVRIFESLNLRPHFISVPLGLARLALPLLQSTRRWRDLRPAMLERMNQDLVFDHAAATRDFGFRPRRFEPNEDTWIRIDRRRPAAP